MFLGHPVCHDATNFALTDHNFSILPQAALIEPEYLYGVTFENQLPYKRFETSCSHLFALNSHSFPGTSLAGDKLVSV